MSRQAIQKAVITVLQQSGEAIKVRDLMSKIRNEKPEFRDVPDFDFRSAVLALAANGTIHSTSTNAVEVRPPVAARG